MVTKFRRVTKSRKEVQLERKLLDVMSFSRVIEIKEMRCR